MKVLITGSKNENLLAPQFLSCAKQLNYEFIPTFYLDILFHYLNRGFVFKAIFRFFPDFVYISINKRLLLDVVKHKPDVVWIFKGMEIFPKTLLKLKSLGIKLVNYNLDHPFSFHSKGSGNSNVINSIELYDLHFTYSKEIQSQMLQKFPTLKVVHLPFGFSTDVLAFKFETLKEVKRVCFIGYGDSDRFKYIKKISNNNLEVDVYGPKWKSILKRHKLKGVKAFPSVTGDEYYRTIMKYRVQLNLLRPHNYLSHNMRSFEVPAVGGIMLAQETPEHLLFFKKNSEAFFFSDENSMIEEIKKVLNLSIEDALNIRVNAKTRSVSSGYSYLERTKESINYIKEIL